MELILNLDFYDMVVSTDRSQPLLGDADGFYPREDLEALIRRAAESGFSTVNFRIAVCGQAFCRSRVKDWASEPVCAQTLLRYDPFEVAVGACHDAGMRCYAWITPFDDKGCGQQSKFSALHPEYQLLSRDGDDPLWGVYSFGYPEVREYFLAHVDELLAYGADGIFFSDRTHSNMDLRQVEYGFNEPVIARYRDLQGTDPREPGGCDLEAFSKVQGEHYTQFLREAAQRIRAAGARCMAKVSWQRDGRIAGRLSALHKSFFEWKTWCRDGIVDELVIGGDAATGIDPEHVIPYYETDVDSASPAHFRETASETTAIHRWLTTYNWGWKGEAECTAGPTRCFTEPVIETMLDRCAESGLDGVLLHEAHGITASDQWELFRRYTQGGDSRRRPATSGIRSVDSGLVYANPKPYLRSRHAFHPTITNLGDGELFCAFDVGEAVESLDYHTVRSRSHDDGHTWGLEGALLEPSDGRVSSHSVRVCRTSVGLIGLGSRAWRDDPEQGILNHGNLGLLPMELFLVRSDNDGRTWSAPETIDTPLVGPAFEICHTVVELPSGRWLAPTSTWRGSDGSLPDGEKAVVLISDDKGETWPEFGVSFDGNAEGLIHWEQSVVALGGDDVLSLAWVYHPDSGTHRPNRYALSRDGGKTFDPPRETGLNGQTCKAIRLSDGRILCAYRHDDRPGLWAALVELEGEKWRNVVQTPLWGTGLAGSGMAGAGRSADELSGLKFGFPQMTQLADGDVLLVFWCFEDWSTRIRWIRLAV